MSGFRLSLLLLPIISVQSRGECDSKGSCSPSRGVDDSGRVQKLDSFMEWVVDNHGWLSPFLEFRYDSRHGFGLFATKQHVFPAKKAVLGVPLALTIKGADPSEPALRLIQEIRLGEKSSLQPYLDILPNANSIASHPLLAITAKQRRKLTGSAALRDLDRFRAALKRCKRNVTAHFEQTDPASPSPNKTQTQWACLVTLTRWFALNDTVSALLPMVDLTNHHLLGMKWAVQTPAPNALRHSKPPMLEAFPVRDLRVKPGQQVYVAYAQRDDAALLLHFGFYHADNPFLTVPFSLSYTLQAAHARQLKQLIATLEEKIDVQVVPVSTKEAASGTAPLTKVHLKTSLD